jgi:hypothetical protein
MITIADLMGSLSAYGEAQRQLALCRKRATGDIEYYAYGYRQDLQAAEANLEHTLNGYIDQRLAEKLERPPSPSMPSVLMPAFSTNPGL